LAYNILKILASKSIFIFFAPNLRLIYFSLQVLRVAEMKYFHTSVPRL